MVCRFVLNQLCQLFFSVSKGINPQPRDSSSPGLSSTDAFRQYAHFAELMQPDTYAVKKLWPCDLLNVRRALPGGHEALDIY